MTKKKENQALTATWPLTKRLVVTYLKPYSSTVFVAVLLMMVSAAMVGWQATLMKPILDDVFIAKDASRLWPIAFMVFAALSVPGIVTYGHTVLMNKVGQRIIANIQKQMFAHLLNADMAFFHEKSSGELMSRLIADTNMMRSAVAESLTAMGKSLMIIVILIGVMFYRDWQLAIISIFVFPLAGLFVAKIGKKLRRVAHDAQEHIAQLTSLLGQVFQGMRHVKSYGAEQIEQDRINNRVEEIFKAMYKAFRVSALATPLSSVLSGLAVCTIITYGGMRVIEGDSTTGDLFSFITAFFMAYEPMKRLAKINNTYQIGLASAQRVFELLDTEPLIKDKENAEKLKVSSSDIVLKDISFTYPDGTQALTKVSLTIPAGKTVALVGPSGSGKSTILNLIPRFYDVTDGSITIENTDIRDVTMSSLRQNMALVSQEIAIFDDTIFDNIVYGSKDKTQKEVEEAAELAAAHKFITELPNGYKTLGGEQGVKLSGGQRQRIAIARAILRNAPILLLDEATSALDTESERLVQDALEILQKGKTTLVVAHRLSTIMNADLIYVMDKGQLVESGTHDELVKNNGLYARLYGLSSKA